MVLAPRGPNQGLSLTLLATVPTSNERMISALKISMQLLTEQGTIQEDKEYQNLALRNLNLERGLF